MMRKDGQVFFINQYSKIEEHVVKLNFKPKSDAFYF
jgi:hypothetical protein